MFSFDAFFTLFLGFFQEFITGEVVEYIDHIFGNIGN